jgi:hypothetical protein
MAADPIVYCLQRVTDYRELERLCSALLLGVGYPRLEPLGGMGDKGRDAVSRGDGERPIVFAYSARTDWRTKLISDCKRIEEMQHHPKKLVFVCTESLTASENDAAHKLVSDKFGWELDLFDLERIRANLVGTQRHLVAQHPTIFAPPFFPQRGGQSIAECRDTVLIDHHVTDHALASWIARQLSLRGFQVWCHGMAPLAGENADETVRQLTNQRAVQYLPVVSTISAVDGIFLERCALAAAREDFVIPCAVGAGLEGLLPSRLKKIVPAQFGHSWRVGLKTLLDRMQALGIEPTLDPGRGTQIALKDFLPAQVTVAKPEPVFANVFPLRLPLAMLVYDLQRSLTESETGELRKVWAFVELNAYRLVAFTPPPLGKLPLVHVTKTPEFAWDAVSEKDGKRTVDVAKDLARRTLEVVCLKRGMVFCPDRKVFYFPKPESGQWNQAIRHVDGRATTVYLTGQKTKGFGERASPFLYQLSPRFRPQRSPDGEWSVIVRVYIRTTDLNGKVFEKKEIGRRRKVVSRSWWNKEWLPRLLGVVQALETSVGRVTLGEGPRTVEMSTAPLQWMCPVGIDVTALSQVSDIGQEMAEYRTRLEEAEEDQEEVASEVESKGESNG